MGKEKMTENATPDAPVPDYPRLIEHAFPLRQASLDSVHEKNVRHGHISTLHIWPARRPLAASRAALLATLLPDPGTPGARKALCERIGGVVVRKTNAKGEVKEETEGGILHWKRETENAGILDELREAVKTANGGRAPRMLDPFAGGGAIPLEAMRLGCEVTASDLNPVAWFVLKCTLEYPQKLAGKTEPLPAFALRDRDFMESYLKKVHGLSGARLKKELQGLGHRSAARSEQTELFEEPGTDDAYRADLAWQVRAWGRWVLKEARRELAALYPTYAEWQPPVLGRAFEPRKPVLIEPDADGLATADALNAEFSDEYLDQKRNPRWIAKPAVAYLWARTVTCKNCRAELPLLKTAWLCKKDKKRVRLVMNPRPDGSGVDFTVEKDVPRKGGNAAQKRAHDDEVGAGTLSRAGAQCPCCSAIMTTEDIRYEGRNARLGQRMTAVVVEGPKGKEYRLPTEHELNMAEAARERLDEVYADVPFGLPTEPTPKCGPGAARAFSVDQYGFDQWHKLFTPRQLVALGVLSKIASTLEKNAEQGLSKPFCQGLVAYLTLLLDKTADYSSNVCSWHNGRELIRNTFGRFALPITWDFAECAMINDVGGSWMAQLEWIALYTEKAMASFLQSPAPSVIRRSATQVGPIHYDVIVTDPPYYDAIPYSDLMDFFYIWLRRSLHGLSPEFEDVYSAPLSPKWNHEEQDGELIDDASRHQGDKTASKRAYEDGMAKAFQAAHASLAPHGRFVIVFAHKHPDAWETLVSAIIRAGFVVDASWPIATEMANCTRALSSAALASSVWLVCKKRNPLAKAGWDNRVLEEMKTKIGDKLRAFWDAGIRGPDFVWAATGPAMEAYSAHPVVKKANAAGELLTVAEFLTEVRRLVVDFAVGRVLEHDGEAQTRDRLDGVTSYYLLHRNDFGFDEAPAGACILYAVSCGMSDADLEKTWGLIKVKKGDGSGGAFVLQGWKQRKGKNLGVEAPGGREVPLIDRVHKLMHLWKAGDPARVDAYLDQHGLRRQELFRRLVQSLIELSDPGDGERAMLESMAHHLGAAPAAHNLTLNLDTE